MKRFSIEFHRSCTCYFAHVKIHSCTFLMHRVKKKEKKRRTEKMKRRKKNHRISVSVPRAASCKNSQESLARLRQRISLLCYAASIKNSGGPTCCLVFASARMVLEHIHAPRNYCNRAACRAIFRRKEIDRRHES